MLHATRMTALAGALMLSSCSLVLDNDDACAANECARARSGIGPATSSGGAPASGCAQTCAGETPICEPSTGECVGCTQDADCAQSATGVCDVEKRRCVECLADVDCEAAGGPPRCDALDQRCVDCAEDAHCQGQGVCEERTHKCVPCNADADCVDPKASQCDPSSHDCVPCASDLHCGHISGRRVCSAQATGAAECVQCTASTESAMCGPRVCDLELHTCTDDMRGGKGTCQPCTYDSECDADPIDPTHRCVRMQFQSQARGTYCLSRASLGCERPYPALTAKLVSASAAPAEAYCQPDPEVTTCEGVLDLDTVSCTRAEQVLCGDPEIAEDASCRSVQGKVNRCTIACRRDVDCAAPQTCSGDMWCE
jgi:hypothetical protein